MRKSTNSLLGLFLSAAAKAFTFIEVRRCFASQSAGVFGLWRQEFLPWAQPQNEQVCRSLQLDREQPRWVNIEND